MSDLDRIKAKIAKCLNLAEKATNEHEAAAAMRQARSLMDKYDLQQVDLIEIGGIQEEMLKSDATRAFSACPQWMQGLAVQVAVFNDCQAVFEGAEITHKPGCKRTKMWGKKIVFRGFRHDVELAVDMYARLVGALNNLFAVYLKEIDHQGRVPISMNNNFKMGAVSTINRILKAAQVERQKLTASSGTGLVLVKGNAVAEYFGQTEYKTAKAKAFANDEAAEAYWEGKKRGEQVEVQRKLD